MKEIFTNFVFIFVIFSPKFYSIFYMKRKKKKKKKKIKEMEYYILNLKEELNTIKNKENDIKASYLHYKDKYNFYNIK